MSVSSTVLFIETFSIDSKFYSVREIDVIKALKLYRKLLKDTNEPRPAEPGFIVESERANL
jgi:hypothetical protein